MAVCPHCRGGPSRAGRPEELARVPSVAPATRAVVTGAEGARVGGGAAAPLVCGSGRGLAAGLVPSRTTGRASPIWVIALAGSRALGAGVAGSGEITAHGPNAVWWRVEELGEAAVDSHL